MKLLCYYIINNKHVKTKLDLNMTENTKKEKSLTIYDILKSITYVKNVDLIHDPNFSHVYNQYAINYFLMAHPTTVHIAMFASEQKMTDAQHYLFLLHCTESEYIYFKREYKEKQNKLFTAEIDAISEYFEINKEHAADIHRLLTEEQVSTIYKLYNTVEVLNGKKLERI